MKKFFAMLLVIVMLASLTTAFAAKYKGWVIKATDIVLTADGQTIELNPIVRVKIGANAEATDLFADIELMKDDQSLAGIWLEEKQGKLGYCALANSETYGVWKPWYSLQKSLLDKLDIKLPDKYKNLPQLAETVDTFMNNPENMQNLLAEVGTVEVTGESSCRLTASFGGYSVQMKLTWKSSNMKKPFKFTDKKKVKFKGFTGTEGFQKAYGELALTLMSEESIAKLVPIAMRFAA